MAEVLSQSQIDALISAALGGGNSGGKDASSGSQGSSPGTPADAQNGKEQPLKLEPKKKYLKYDFRSPRKYTRERIKILNSIFENYSKVLNTRINGLLHTSCEVEVDTVDEQRYFEFSNALIDGEVVSLTYLMMNGKRSSDPVIVCASPTVMVSMMDRLMGGNGDVEDDLPADYTFTSLDLSLYKNLMEDFVSVMGSSWESYVDLSFVFERVEPNPTMMQLISIEETVILVSLNIKFQNCEGHIDVCMPDSVLSTVFEEIQKQNNTTRVDRENRSEDIYSNIKDSSLDIIAELGRTTVQLQDIYSLNVGDVIDMGLKKDSAVSLRIGGRQWFSGLMGTHEKKIAVKIQDVYGSIKGGSEQEDEQ